MRRQAARILAQSAAVAQSKWSYARNARNPHSLQSFLAGLSVFDTRVVPLTYRHTSERHSAIDLCRLDKGETDNVKGEFNPKASLCLRDHNSAWSWSYRIG